MAKSMKTSAQLKQAKEKRAKKAMQKWLRSPEMTKKHVVPISTEGMKEVAIEMSMADRLQEKKLPQVRGALVNPHVPVKLGSTKGYVHWKIDATRMKNFTNAEGNKLTQGRYKQLLKDAKKHGLLTN